MSRDNTTGKDVVLSFEHYMVHDGGMYMASYYSTVTAASSDQFWIFTGAKDTHVQIGVDASGQALVQMYEGATGTGAFGAGMTVTCFNMYRNSANSCLAVCWHSNPHSIAATTRLLYTDLILGGNKVNTMIGASARRETELVLKPSTRYLVQVTNEAAATITTAVNIQFYELEI